MAMSPSEKAQWKREGLLGVALRYSAGTYKSRFVSPIFQRMIRAEEAARPDSTCPAIVGGTLRQVGRRIGQCVCVTCGKVGPWSEGLGGMHTGHFLASRRNSILYEESNVAPQCSRCNRYEHGAPQRFRLWMLAVRGEDVVRRLELLKDTVVEFTKEDLVDLRIAYQARLDAAMQQMVAEAEEGEQ